MMTSAQPCRPADTAVRSHHGMPAPPYRCERFTKKRRGQIDRSRRPPCLLRQPHVGPPVCCQREIFLYDPVAVGLGLAVTVLLADQLKLPFRLFPNAPIMHQANLTFNYFLAVFGMCHWFSVQIQVLGIDRLRLKHMVKFGGRMLRP